MDNILKTGAQAAPAAFGKAPRLAALDAARILGIAAMVFGHTLDALLSPEARSLPGVVIYWQFRGLTAPLFMIVSGWAVFTAISRSNAAGFAILRGRMPRILLILCIGTFLRWPGWNMRGFFSGDLPVWKHVLAIDALQLIALSMLISALALSVIPGRRGRWIVFSGLAALTLAGTAFYGNPSLNPETLPYLAWMQLLGGTSPFPLLPWSAYFFTGVMVAMALGDKPETRRVLTLFGTGALLAIAAAQIVPGEMWRNSLWMLSRTGKVFMILALLWLVPGKTVRPIAPLGRHSLGIYAIHVPLVYGCFLFAGLNKSALGKSLDVLPALCAALILLLACFGLLYLWNYALKKAGLFIRKASSENPPPKLCSGELPRRNAHLPMCKLPFRLGRKP